MHNCFKKYFLLFASFFLLQPLYAMESNRFSWLGYIYATITNYLPTFSLPSFLTKYNFRRKIEQTIHNNTTISTDNEEPWEFGPPPVSHTIVYGLANERLSDIPKTTTENIIQESSKKSQNRFIKVNINRKKRPSSQTLQNLDSNQKTINEIWAKHTELSAKIANFSKPIETYKKLDTKIDEKFSLTQIDKDFFNAIKEQKKDLFISLLKKGANINACDIDGQTVLHKYVYRQSFYHNITVNDLIDNGAERNIQDKYGRTPLFLAIAQQCAPAVIESLITKENINQPNIHGITPLRCALYRIHNQEIFNVLYKNEASLINIDNEKNSVFHHLVHLDKRQLEGLIASIIKYTYHSYIPEEGFVKIEKLEESLRNSTVEKQFSGITFDEKQLIADLLTNQNYKDVPTLYSVMHQMIRIQEALQHRNKQNQTPWQLLHKLCGKTRLKNIKDLFDENRPKNDFIIFLKAFPNPISVPVPHQKERKSNWAEIAYHYYKSQ